MAGYKTWTPGAIITASDVQNYLQDQSVMVFASSSVRATAIPAPSAGMLTYLENTQAVEVYKSSTWQPIGVNTVTAGTGLSGGGSSGTVTLNVNPSGMVFGATAVTSNYALASGIDNQTIRVTGTANVTVTVHDVLATGNSVNVIADTSGTVTLVAGNGVTDWAGAGTAGTAVSFILDERYNGAQVIKVASGAYRVIGKVTV